MMGSNNLSAVLTEKERERIAREFYDGSKEPFNNEVFEKTYRKLSEGVSKGYARTSYDETDARMVYELLNNVAVFAAFKSYRMGGDAIATTVSPSGERLSWVEFYKEFKKLDSNYNKNWLEAEYNMAQRQARAAEMWGDFERDQDTFPNLEWMPSRSANPRQAHLKYYGVIRPINDPFWDIIPPADWGCKCWIRQTRADITGRVDNSPEKVLGVAGNPGRTRQVFSPDHPYVQNTTQREDVAKALRIARDAIGNDYITLPGKKGKVKISVNADPVDYYNNVAMAKLVVDKYTGVFEVRPNITGGIKNPEYKYKGVIGDRTEWERANSVENFIENGWQKKKKKNQLSGYKESFIGFDFLGKLNDENITDMVRKINGKLLSSKKTKFVLLKNKDNVIIIKKDTDYQTMLTEARKELLK